MEEGDPIPLEAPTFVHCFQFSPSPEQFLLVVELCHYFSLNQKQIFSKIPNLTKTTASEDQRKALMVFKRKSKFLEKSLPQTVLLVNYQEILPLVHLLSPKQLLVSNIVLDPVPVKSKKNKSIEPESSPTSSPTRKDQKGVQPGNSQAQDPNNSQNFQNQYQNQTQFQNQTQTQTQTQNQNLQQNFKPTNPQPQHILTSQQQQQYFNSLQDQNSKFPPEQKTSLHTNSNFQNLSSFLPQQQHNESSFQYPSL